MNRVIVVPLRVSDDVALARYAVPAAHAERGAVVVLDLTEVSGVDADLADLVGECSRTARGNGQRLALLLPAAAAALPAAGDDAARFDGLESCLASVAPATGRSYAIALTLPARIEYLAPVRRHLSAVVRTLHGDADAFQVEILVDELCLNAVENSPSDRNAYDVSFACEGDEVRLDVVNAFDESVNSERIMHRRLKSFDASGDYLGERGRGLFLVGRIADGLQIRSVPGGRIQVAITKRLGRFATQAVPTVSERTGDQAR